MRQEETSDQFRARISEQHRLAREAQRADVVGKTRDKPMTVEEKDAHTRRLHPPTDHAGQLAVDVVEDRLREGKTHSEILAELERAGLPIPEGFGPEAA